MKNSIVVRALLNKCAEPARALSMQNIDKHRYIYMPFCSALYALAIGQPKAFTMRNIFLTQSIQMDCPILKENCHTFHCRQHPTSRPHKSDTFSYTHFAPRIAHGSKLKIKKEKIKQRNMPYTHQWHRHRHSSLNAVYYISNRAKATNQICSVDGAHPCVLPFRTFGNCAGAPVAALNTHTHTPY